MSPEPLKTDSSIRFGDGFELDLRAYQLRRFDRPLSLEPIPMEILTLLLEQRGHLVTRDQIIQRIWGSEVHVDVSSSINAAVVKIRRALHDHSGKPRFVETVARKGYRFIAPTQQAPSLLPPLERPRPEKILSDNGPINLNPPKPALTTVSTSQVTPQVRPSKRKWELYLVLAVLMVLAIVFSFQKLRRRPQPQPINPRAMLAVLPFENLTGDPGQDYFSDGMTEEMITSIGRIDPDHLGLIARTSVMHYKHTSEPLSQIARELGVQYVLEGSVRRYSNVVRISVRLVQLKDQSELWSRQYDRELSNLLSLQGEIAHEIARELQPTLAANHPSDLNNLRPSSPESTQAYELYLRGRYFWSKRTPEGVQRSIDYFQQAINNDPNDARAYAALAESYALFGGYNAVPPGDSIVNARAAARRSIELDGTLPEAHTALAVIAQTYDWDWQTAEKEYRRAIQLDPNFATGHHWYAECLALQGRFDESFSEIERARVLDPLSLIIATDRGAILYFSRQYDRAIDQFRSVLDTEPDFPRAHMLGAAYSAKGMNAEALADAQISVHNHDTAWTRAILAYALGRAGHRAQAQREFARLQEFSRHHPVDSLALVVASLGVDNHEQAIASLQKAFLEHSTSLTALKVDPIYDPLRSDPRFHTILHKLNLE